MINLIPPSAKKAITFEYWVRVGTVWLLLVSVAAAFGVVVLLPPYVLINSQVLVYKESANQATEKLASYENVSVGLVRASQQSRIIIDSAKMNPMSGYIYLFESLQNPGVSLSEITISRSVSGIAPVTLVGVATSRQTLASFRDRLLARNEVVSVDFPISNLAKDRDIPFSITVEMNNELTP